MFIAALLIMSHAQAQAYTGPGLGLGIIGVAVGVLGSIFLGIVAVVWYPIKRLFRALRKHRERPPSDDANSSE